MTINARKTQGWLGAFLLIAGGASAPAWGIVIDDPTAGLNDGLDVGSIDTLIGSTNDYTEGGTICGGLNGIQLEDCWAEDATGVLLDFTDASKTEDVAAYSTDDPSVLAFMLSYGSGYYLIKNSTWSAVFLNLVATDWGVIDTSLLPSGFNLTGSGTTISHVTESAVTSVPEPGSLGLLGLGLLAVAFGHRGRQRRITREA